MIYAFGKSKKDDTREGNNGLVFKIDLGCTLRKKTLTNQDSAILAIALDLLQCRNATPEQVLQVFKAIVDLDGKGWVVSAFRYRLCQLLVHIAESNLDLVSQIVDVPREKQQTRTR